MSGIKLGLTGSIGCGKSTAGALFGEAGFARSDSDLVVKELLRSDPEVLRAIRERFGDEMMLPEGGVDRAAMAKVVFTDKTELKWLETLLHPRVSATWQARVQAEPEADWCVEIPLLFEKNLEKHFDFTVCLYASERTQLARLAGRGVSEDQARARIRRQLPLDQKVARADFVLLNDGDHAFLRQQVFFLIEQLLPAS